ncbi:MAG TPA: endonuclease [Candidatus Cloacimonadota bacterium]|jgi:endonuclease I|nr:endonuclease [Candidatus Cloacimonadales bacterium]HPY96497.1 endonuclease [Candidatus Cloacimonadota bacterium]HQB41527.1 endonuclease [Candidatus Cloacimonadota bacterium]
MKNILFSLLIGLTCVLQAIPISFNMQEINVTNAIANQNYDQTLRIFSNSNDSQEITILHRNRSFSLTDTLFTLAAHDSIDIAISFNGKHNIAYKDVFYFINSDNQVPSILEANVPVNYTESIYTTTYNKWDNELKTAIFNLINNHTALGYNGARQEMFGTIDNVDGWVECVYTGQMVQTNGIPDVNTQHMNTEHTWPQSYGASGDAKSDLYHLYPANETANSIRGNLPFGNVVSGQNWSVGGSKRGYNESGTLVFEPRDVHKGDVARAMIYFAIRYNNPQAPFFNNQENTLRQWSLDDPVSTKEAQRNDAIAARQHKRNAFIDHPEFIDRIYTISGSAVRPQVANYYFPITNINAFYNENITLPIANYGNAALQINSVISSSNLCTISNYPNSIPAESSGLININIGQPSSENNCTITINTSVGTYQVTINCQETSVDDNTIAPQYFQTSIYPNPISKQATLELFTQEKTREPLSITVYNAKGQIIDSWHYQNTIEKVNMNFDNKKYSNGIYFLKIKQANQEQVKKIIIMK